MVDRINIMKANQSNTEDVVNLFKRVKKHMLEQGIDQWDELYPNKEVIKEDIDKQQLYIAEYKHNIIAIFVINKDYDEAYGQGSWRYIRGEYYVLHRFCIEPSMQGKGFATRIILLIEKEVRQLGGQAIRLDAFSKNPAAIHMYEKLGYQSVGQVVFRKGIFYLYEKWIEHNTTSTNPYWDRTIPLAIESERRLYPEGINEQKLKIVYLLPSNGIVSVNGNQFKNVKPVIMLLREEEDIVTESAICKFIIYMEPGMINDSFTYELISSGDIEKLVGTTDYQDYYLLKAFYEYPLEQRIHSIEPDCSGSVNAIVEGMVRTIQDQKDYWPCRCRSYCIQLLFLLQGLMETKYGEMVKSQVCVESYTQQVQKIIFYLNENIDKKITIRELEQEFCMNRNKMNQIFAEATGVTVITYLIHMRVKLASYLLKNTELSIYEIGEQVGFTDSGYFTRTFKKLMGMTPKDYREDNEIVSP